MMNDEARAAIHETIQAIEAWSLAGAMERVEMVGNLGTGKEVFSLQDLLLFWASECPEVLQVLAAKVPLQYWEQEEEHVPEPVRKIDNSPQALLKRMARL